MSLGMGRGIPVDQFLELVKRMSVVVIRAEGKVAEAVIPAEMMRIAANTPMFAFQVEEGKREVRRGVNR
jgi:hypothetical protein